MSRFGVHEWRSKSGRPWSLRVRSDDCGLCGHTPDSAEHMQQADHDAAAIKVLVLAIEASGITIGGEGRILRALRSLGWDVAPRTQPEGA